MGLCGLSVEVCLLIWTFGVTSVVVLGMVAGTVSYRDFTNPGISFVVNGWEGIVVGCPLECFPDDEPTIASS